MTDDADCPPMTTRPPAAPGGTEAVAARLGTLQRNALRKLLNRPEFTPAEVYELGYRRILRAEGIGQKGMQCIQAWLRAHGFDLQPPPVQPEPPLRLSAELRRNIDSALRLLRDHGYRVRRTGDK